MSLMATPYLDGSPSFAFHSQDKLVRRTFWWSKVEGLGSVELRDESLWSVGSDLDHTVISCHLNLTKCLRHRA